MSDKEVKVEEVDDELQEEAEEFWHQLGHFFARLFVAE